jgi:hypothetical protein
VQSVLVFILAVMWSVYFGMWLLSRRERRSMNSIATFNKHLAVLGRTAPGRSVHARTPTTGWDTPGRAGPMAPPVGYGPLHGGMTLADARNRRRQMLTSLAAAASVTAGLAFLGGGPMLAVHLVADVMLAGYVVALVRSRQTVTDRRSKVVYLPRQVTPVAPAPVYLQRSAN